MIIDETKLEKYIDNTMQGGLILPDKIKGVTLNVVSDSRTGSIGTSKYTTKQQSPSNTIIGKVNLDSVDMLSRNMSQNLPTGPMVMTSQGILNKAK